MATDKYGRYWFEYAKNWYGAVMPPPSNIAAMRRRAMKRDRKARHDRAVRYINEEDRWYSGLTFILIKYSIVMLVLMTLWAIIFQRV